MAICYEIFVITLLMAKQQLLITQLLLNIFADTVLFT